MKQIRVSIYITLMSILTLNSQSYALENFIKREGHQLFNGEKEFRFAGIHAPELHRIEDDSQGPCEADPRGWGQHFKWPTADEQENWIKSLVRTGHKAMRITVLSIEQEHDKACGREVHVLRPETKGGYPRLNEEGMVHYDRLIALAHQHDLRLILPFVDHWEWWGGRKQLAEFYNEREDDFYNTESLTYKAYQDIIRQVIYRRNTFTGRLYRDEKAIMAWETGNELEGTNKKFLNETSALIKRIDPNHLVIDGNYKQVTDFSIEDPNVDIVSNHLYANVGNLKPETVLADLKKIDGKKAYFVGEFGLLPIEKLAAIMDEVVHREHNGAKAIGSLIWGFRGRRHNGGFYWHNEPANTNVYSYHIPGFPEGDFNEELAVVNLAREAIAQLDGHDEMIPLPVPEAPKLREIESVDRINWLGAPVGRTYRVERAERRKGPWKVIADDISDGKNKYNPEVDSLFSDTSKLSKRKRYYYRVIAKNESGESGPSNIVEYVAK